MEKPILEYKSKNIFEVDYIDLNFFINDVYGEHVKYEFAHDVEADNDTIHSFDVHKEEINIKFDIDKFEKFKKGERVYYMTRILLIDCCNRDLIPEGEYLVKICW